MPLPPAAVIELIDVLRENGEPSGERKSKADVHRDGDWHRAAHVWIVAPDGRILLQRRSWKKENHPGLWDVSAAGHLSAGETAIESAIRETGEELGLTIAPSDLRYLTTTRESWVLNGETYIDNEFHEIFLVRREVDVSLLSLDPEEVAEVRWVNRLRPDDTFVSHAEEYALLSRWLR